MPTNCRMSRTMRRLILPILFLCCTVSVHAQEERSTASKLDGCYEVISSSWSPPDESIRFIPPRFKLTADGHVHPVPSKSEDLPCGSWTAQAKKLKLSFGCLGGFRGSLKSSSPGEFDGKLKEYSDRRCWPKWWCGSEGKRRTGVLRIRKTDCGG
jgi:hypothetical protein